MFYFSVFFFYVSIVNRRLCCCDNSTACAFDCKVKILACTEPWEGRKRRKKIKYRVIYCGRPMNSRAKKINCPIVQTAGKFYWPYRSIEVFSCTNLSKPSFLQANLFHQPQVICFHFYLFKNQISTFVCVKLFHFFFPHCKFFKYSTDN